LQAVGLFLLVVVCIANGSPRRKYTPFVAFFYAALVVGVIGAVDEPLRQSFRDIVAHLFLGLNVLWVSRLDERLSRILMFFMSLAGTLIGIRFLFETGFSFSALAYKSSFTFDGLLKLNTDPLVIFAGGYGLSVAFDNSRSTLERAALLVFSVPGLMAIGLSGLRGPLAIIIVVAAIALYQSKVFSNWYSFLIVVALMFLAFMNFDIIYTFYNNFSNKMSVAGTSAKSNEFFYVMFNAGSNIFRFLFGSGFGSQIDLGERSLAFTHTALSYYFAKAGVLVAILFVFFIISIIFNFTTQKLFRQPDAVLLLFIVLYGLMLNPHYKYMTFGFILVMLLNRCQIAQGLSTKLVGRNKLALAP